MPNMGVSKVNEAANDKAKPAKKYFYFVDGTKYDSNEPSMRAADILSRVPNAEPGDKLSIDGQGDDPDRLLNDDDRVEFEKDKGPVRMTLVPSASFGA